MSYAIQTTHEVSQEAITAQHAYEDKVIREMLDAFDRVLESTGGMAGDRELRRDFQTAHLNAAAMVMTMANMPARKLVAAFVQLAGVWRDLNAAAPADRIAAGKILDPLAELIRTSRGLPRQA